VDGVTSFSVPTLDLRTATPTEIADALIGSSCAFIVGHDVSEALMTEMVSVSKAFFDLDREEKGKVRWLGDGRWRGWQPVDQGAEELTGDRAPDLLERFETQMTGRRGTDPQAHQALRDSFAFWPERPVELADIWTRYYVAMGELASRLTRSIAEALDLPRELLPLWCEEQDANLVAINYPAQLTPPQEGQLRIGGHTDRGGFTLLWADDAPGGLEVMLTGTREWIPVTIPSGAYLMQIGDMLSRWTNRLIKPNVHRVVNPPADVAATSRRLSMPYFQYPRLDITIEPAPSCVTAERPAAKPLVAIEHFYQRQEGYKARRDDNLEEALREYA
jgi:isopenicillin N synthase-like dioxygenase